MADNTVQYECIVTIKGNLDLLFADNPDVFVAGDLLWYPVEGDNKTRTAPDVMVVFGRPKGDRPSYKQWEEQGIAPQVVFEVLSPGNRLSELVEKFLFYQRFGVEEYYVYDPDTGRLDGWLRSNDGTLQPIEQMDGWVSPRLGIRFSVQGTDLVLTRPDGLPFVTPEELEARWAEAEERVREAEYRAQEAEARAERLAARLRELGIEAE
ncbi:MAG: Uma2 family endonuclease [bacterium]|nr:Uma2 family endonuclease [bacterium]